MKILINRIFTLLVTIFATFVFSRAFAIDVYTFQDKPYDAAAGTVGYSYGGRSILNTISSVNSYIWFFVGFFCFVFMIWNGYKLISANGDEKAMKSARTALLWSVVWLAICILSYIIVNVAVKLFA